MAYFRILSLSLILITFSFFGCSKNQNLEQNKAAILAVMEQQESDWNSRDFEGFMQGYWQNDSLKFYGSKGVTKGWQQTLNNYIEGYPTEKESGTLKFTIDDISPVESNSYSVMGQYHLIREMGDAKGNFLIIFKKINGEWKIIADMSS